MRGGLLERPSAAERIRDALEAGAGELGVLAVRKVVLVFGHDAAVAESELAAVCLLDLGHVGKAEHGVNSFNHGRVVDVGLGVHLGFYILEARSGLGGAFGSASSSVGEGRLGFCLSNLFVQATFDGLLDALGDEKLLDRSSRR